MDWLRRIWYLLNRRRLEAEMEKEMAHHREMLGPGGRHDFGDDLRLREDAREVWGWTWLDRLWQDLTYGARVFRKSPGFTLTAVTVLALGIGVTLTATRMVLREMRPPMVPDPDTLMFLERQAPGSRGSVSYPMLVYYREHAKSFQSIIGRLDSNVLLGDEPEPVASAFVTPNYFAEFGIRATYGRVLLSGVDEAADSEPVVLLSQRFWERRMGGDRTVIGRIVRLNGKPARVVGIVAASVGRAAIWIPLARQPYVMEGSTLLTDWRGGMQVYGRLKPGIGREASEEETRALAAALWEELPREVWKGEWLAAKRLGQLEFKDAAKVVMAVALVMLLLVVACANLGTLLLARGVSREREIRTRMALGADRRRVVRQLLTESLLLAVTSSLAALFFSTIAIRAMQSLSETPEGWGMVPDWRVLAATLAIALVAAASFGLVPALRLTSSAPHAGRSRTLFLAVQVGASCMLLMVSGLLVRSVERLSAADPGFDFSRVVVIVPGLSAHGYQAATAVSYMQRLSDRLRAVSGVERVSMMELAPWGNQRWQERPGGNKVDLNHVDAEFVEALGLRLVRGRNFRPGEQGVAIVSESVARWQWPGEDPVGKSLALGDRGTVIGVVAKAGTFDLRTEEPLGVYFPPGSRDWTGTPQGESHQPGALVVRVSGRPGDYLGIFANAAKDQDRRLQPDVRLLQPEYDRVIADNRLLSTTVGMLGIVATLLSAIGLAGLTGYTVAQRTREIGVRVALGARGAQVVRAILRPMLRPVGIGFLSGAAGAAGLSLILRRDIFGLRALDATAYLVAIAMFTATMAAATMAPVRRAMSVSPTEALRHE